MFGEAKIRLVSQVDDKITFSLLEGSVPSTGNLSQRGVAMTTNEIQDAFNDFWSTYWLRDSALEACAPEPWSSFVKQVRHSNLPEIPEFQVDLESVQPWMDAIQGLKSGKAHGIEGWRYEEFKKLPKVCIADLAAIMARGARFGLSQPLMSAKTTLLAKVPVPQSLHHIRPIPVLGAIYRLIYWSGDSQTNCETVGCSFPDPDFWRITW